MMDLINVHVEQYVGGFCEICVDGVVEAFAQTPDGVVEMIENWLDENDLTDGDIEVIGFDEYYID